MSSDQAVKQSSIKRDGDVPVTPEPNENIKVSPLGIEPQIKSDQQEENSSSDEQRPIILEGKRSRKIVSRFDLNKLAPMKKEFTIPKGRGKPLGEIEYINYRITRASTDGLSHLRQICFGRRGSQATIRKNLREFRGFEFQQRSDEYEKHLKQLLKLKKDQLRSISNILGLTSTGRLTEHAERILTFLVEPKNQGKRIPKKKTQKKGKTAKVNGHSKVNDIVQSSEKSSNDSVSSQSNHEQNDQLSTDNETNSPH